MGVQVRVVDMEQNFESGREVQSSTSTSYLWQGTRITENGKIKSLRSSPSNTSQSVSKVVLEYVAKYF